MFYVYLLRDVGHRPSFPNGVISPSTIWKNRTQLRVTMIVSRFSRSRGRNPCDLYIYFLSTLYVRCYLI